MDIHDMKMIGQGNTAEVYEFEENKVLKLFREGIDRVIVMQEYETSVFIQSHIDHVPKAFSHIDAGNRYGIVYERIDGKDMLVRMFDSVQQVDVLSKMLAHMQINIHNHMITNTDVIPSVKSKLINEIKDVDVISNEEKDYLINYVGTLPDGNSLCHFDFHPGNVIMRGNSPIIIDWMTACFGDPCADIARTYILLNHGEMPNENLEKQQFIRDYQKRILETYYLEYLSYSGRNKEEIEKWILPIETARLREWLPDSEKSVLMADINRRIEHLRKS